MKKNWKIWIDTGGTFTDCLAMSPEGKFKKAKVLSSSRLRGTIRQVAAPDRLLVATNWGVDKDIFEGYDFQLPGRPGAVKVKSLSPETGELQLAEPLPQTEHLAAQGFEITAGEEAPVLAARLVTGTPLYQPLPPADMRLGSTRGTNALLERKIARVAFITTRGFGDLLLIRDQQRPDIFALNIQKPAPLYHVALEARERTAADGKVLQPLQPREMERLAREVGQSGAGTVAIALMHAWRNPLQERQLKQFFQQKGYRFVSCSHELAPEIRLLPRAETAVVNACLSPIIEDYLQSIAKEVSGRLRVMSSAGGLVGREFFKPKDSLLSGPAGGVVGAADVARKAGFPHIITLDMGGTSTDVSRYHGQFDYTWQQQVGEARLLSPALAIHTVAAGGGSLCQFNGHKLTAGPESAGASPGPACYGAGGGLAITDVNLLLGRLDPENFGIPVDVEAAGAALAQLRRHMKNAGQAAPHEQVLAGLLQIANEKMAEAIRQISVRKGYDPRGYALLAFGGAGGQHACAVASLLGMSRVLVPLNASLLSAWGMGQALIERFAQKQVLQPLSSALPNLPRLVQEAASEALQSLSAEGVAENDMQVRQKSCFLRFAGQENELEVPFEQPENLLPDFEKQYRQLFGHWVANRAVELVSVKVIASTVRAAPPQNREEPAIFAPEPHKLQRAFIGAQWRQVPVFYLDRLRPGAKVHGPALLVSQTTTVVAEPGWYLQLDRQLNACLYFDGETPVAAVQTSRQPEAVMLELFTNRFSAIAAEMGALLQRTAFSVNVKERMDFSCALLDSEGGLVVNAPHIPVHLGSMGLCVRSLMQTLPMQPGDVVITNHPGFGGSHLPDITLVAPVFDEAGELLGYVASRAHHAETGGKSPGSMPPDARHLAEEGVVIFPQYLVKGGETRWQAIERVFTQAPYPTRALQENLADLNAALASLESAKTQLRQLAQTEGSDSVRAYMQKLKQYAGRLMSESITALHKKNYYAEECLDDGSAIRVNMTVEGEGLTVDFTGSAGVYPGNLNATPAIVNSAVMYVLRLLLRKDLPLNEGLIEKVRLILPQGMLNPPFPEDPTACPAVVGGNTETSQRVVDTLLKALELSACSYGSMNNLLFGNSRFGFYETIGGGTGAGPDFHGADAVHQHMTNTRITDPEMLEFRYPVRLRQFAIRQASGGNGRWQGGNGIVREVEFLEDLQVTLLTQHRKEVPYGMQGGEPGKAGEQYLLYKDGTEEPLPGICSFSATAGQAVKVLTPGGGGWGKTEA